MNYQVLQDGYWEIVFTIGSGANLNPIKADNPLCSPPSGTDMNASRITLTLLDKDGNQRVQVTFKGVSSSTIFV